MMHKDVAKILFSEKDIEQRCLMMAKQISDDYKDDPPIVVGLLKGCIPFMWELIKRIEINIEIEYMDVTSYEGSESTGDVRILKDLDRSINGRHILLVEDIIDTGRTLKKVTELLASKGAKSVKIATLLDKPSRRVVEINGDYVGFEIPNEFVVGFGLDFNQKYRNLPYVGVLKEELYKE